LHDNYLEPNNSNKIVIKRGTYSRTHPNTQSNANVDAMMVITPKTVKEIPAPTATCNGPYASMSCDAY